MSKPSKVRRVHYANRLVVELADKQTIAHRPMSHIGDGCQDSAAGAENVPHLAEQLGWLGKMLKNVCQYHSVERTMFLEHIAIGDSADHLEAATSRERSALWVRLESDYLGMTTP